MLIKKSPPLWLQPYSDLHNEFNPFYPPKHESDKDTIIILAGDIDLNDKAIDWISSFNDRYWGWVYVTGNHERWGTGLDTAISAIRSKIIKKKLKNVWVLDNDVITINLNDTILRILGCTLWTDYFNGDPMSIAGAVHASWDYKKIRHNNGNRPITPLDLAFEHQNSLDWLIHELSVKHNGPSLVVTHHSPSALSFKERTNSKFSSGCYHSNLESLFFENEVSMWIHGHIHNKSDYTINKTRVLCNPRGYVGEEINPDFIPVWRIPLSVNKVD